LSIGQNSNSEKLGKILLQEDGLLLASRLGLHQCLVDFYSSPCIACFKDFAPY